LISRRGGDSALRRRMSGLGRAATRFSRLLRTNAVLGVNPNALLGFHPRTAVSSCYQEVLLTEPADLAGFVSKIS